MDEMFPDIWSSETINHSSALSPSPAYTLNLIECSWPDPLGDVGDGLSGIYFEESLPVQRSPLITTESNDTWNSDPLDFHPTNAVRPEEVFTHLQAWGDAQKIAETSNSTTLHPEVLQESTTSNQLPNKDCTLLDLEEMKGIDNSEPPQQNSQLLELEQQTLPLHGLKLQLQEFVQQHNFDPEETTATPNILQSLGEFQFLGPTLMLPDSGRTDSGYNINPMKSLSLEQEARPSIDQSQNSMVSACRVPEIPHSAAGSTIVAAPTPAVVQQSNAVSVIKFGIKSNAPATGTVTKPNPNCMPVIQNSPNTALDSNEAVTTVPRRDNNKLVAGKNENKSSKEFPEADESGRCSVVSGEPKDEKHCTKRRLNTAACKNKKANAVAKKSKLQKDIMEQEQVARNDAEEKVTLAQQVEKLQKEFERMKWKMELLTHICMETKNSRCC